MPSLAERYPELPRYPQPDGAVKLAAGWLIEQCGWKGRSLGAVGVYEQQALVLVNRGGARGAEVLRLAQAIQASVQAGSALRWNWSRWCCESPSSTATLSGTGQPLKS